MNNKNATSMKVTKVTCLNLADVYMFTKRSGLPDRLLSDIEGELRQAMEERERRMQEAQPRLYSTLETHAQVSAVSKLTFACDHKFNKKNYSIFCCKNGPSG